MREVGLQAGRQVYPKAWKSFFPGWIAFDLTNEGQVSYEQGEAP